MNGTVLVTGAHGFIGRNLIARLRDGGGVTIHSCTRETTAAELAEMLATADTVFHLAGVNRPHTIEEFQSGNADFTEQLAGMVLDSGRSPVVVFASSIQAQRDNPYGRSKRAAEMALSRLAERSGARVVIFRLTNVFGKWCRPDYNSVVATFCHNVARDLPITIRDSDHSVDLVHVDDVVAAFLRAAEGSVTVGRDHVVADEIPASTISLGDLAARIRSYHDMRRTLMIPDLSERLGRQLYSTYVSYLEPKDWEYGLDRHDDDRGDLAELLKSRWFGQVFVSRTRPGITRGNHYHHTKTEKFFVIAGVALVRFRHVEREEVLEFTVRGEEYRVIDIPPGYTHSITNVGEGEMITLFWASEVFDPERSDSTFAPVDGIGGFGG